MKFFAIATLVATALALPANELEARQRGPALCGSGALSGELSCCQTSVLGLAALKCETPRNSPTSPANFRSICSSSGSSAKCCVLRIADVGVLCKDVAGAN